MKKIQEEGINIKEVTSKIVFHLKEFNKEAVISITLDIVLKNQLKNTHTYFVQTREWQNIKTLMMSEDIQNIYLGFQLLEGQTSKSIRFFFESLLLNKSFKKYKLMVHDTIELLKIEKQKDKECSEIVEYIDHLNNQWIISNIPEEKVRIEKEIEYLIKNMQQKEDVRKRSTEIVTYSGDYMINKVIQVLKTTLQRNNIYIENLDIKDS